jgi:orotate phosphoribosyltransferase
MTELKEMLKECGAIKYGDFTLTSGKKSSYYIDIKLAITDPHILREIAKLMAEDVIEDRIAGMELGAVPIATAVALESMKPLLIIRKEEKCHGTASLFEGKLKEGESVLVVEDVATTGGSIVKAVEAISAAGAKVTRVKVVVDREEGARDRIELMGLEYLPLVTKKDILEE